MTSAVHLHVVEGCNPTPLASYLKALGILRLVSQQSDPAARGWWQQDRFHFATTLDAATLERFFLDEYVPTPILAPWNGGSGFYPKDTKTGIDAIANSRADRFEPYREAIAQSRTICDGLEKAPKHEVKEALIRRLGETWRTAAAEWLAAAVVIRPDGSASYPALLGTGGNDGRLDFTNNFMQRLVECIDMASEDGRHAMAARPLLASALWAAPVSGLASAAIGQFNPRGAGGANGTNGFTADSLVNPWDFILMLEGSIFFAASIVRRADTNAPGRAVAPFAVGGIAAGYGSAATADESARGEQWMPLWDRPASTAEVSGILSEGRSQIGRRNAREAVDFTRAVSRLGVARGISAFQRFGYIERNGQANLATPLGRWSVSLRPYQRLIDELAPWVSRLYRAANVQHAPASFASIARRCNEALMACETTSPTAIRWQALLTAVGAAERLAVRNPRFSAERGLQPLPRLSAEWLFAIDDGSAEVRLAAVIGSTRYGKHAPAHGTSIRDYWLPVERSARSVRFVTGQSGIAVGVKQVCRGIDLIEDLTALARRRCIESARSGDRMLGLSATASRLADGSSISRLIRGDFDDAKCLSVAMPLMAVEWSRASEAVSELAKQRRPRTGDDLDVIYGVLRLAVPLGPLPHQLAADFGEPNLRMDTAVLKHLTAGNLPRAFQSALRQVRASGLRPKVRLAAGDSERAVRLAAALAVPVAHRALRRVVELAIKPERVAGESVNPE